MKKILVLAVNVTAIFITTLSHAITIGFDPASQDVVLGNTASINLVISDLGDNIAPSLGGFDIDITYNPAILSLSSVVFGNQVDIFGFGQSDQFVIFESGGVNIFELSYDDPFDLEDLQPSSFILATLSFNTIGYGTSSMDITNIILSDEWAEPLFADTTTSGRINVTHAAVPEPSIFFLVVSGLIGMGCLRRKDIL